MAEVDPRDALIAELRAQVAERDARIAQLLAKVEELTARVAELEARLGQNSNNSSKPPSSDPPGRARQRKKPTGRNPGGQPGHKKHEHSSVVSKQQILKDHIMPFFGGMALAAIGPAEIEDFKSVMLKKPSGARARKEAPTQAAIRKRKDVEPKTLSRKTINNALMVLGKLMALAEEQRVIPQAPRVKLFSKLPKPPFDFLTFEEAERLIDAADSEWRTLILVALKTGLREGELMGPQWADLDLPRGKLQVRHASGAV